jgi:hypothetical protein
MGDSAEREAAGVMRRPWGAAMTTGPPPDFVVQGLLPNRGRVTLARMNGRYRTVAHGHFTGAQRQAIRDAEAAIQQNTLRGELDAVRILQAAGFEVTIVQ